MFKHILVPTDGSELSRRTALLAVELAKCHGARLCFFHAVAEPPFPVSGFGEDSHYDPDKPKRFSADAEQRGGGLLDDLLTVAREAGVDAASVLATSDAPCQAIIRAVEEHACDLIVMASHGRRGLDALILGSETNKVLTHCRVPVLVCR